MHHGVPADIKVSRDLAYGRPFAEARRVTAPGTGKPMLIFVHGAGSRAVTAWR
jgi:hypothetical protein